MGRGGAWDASEDEALRELYPVHGPSWERWGEFLPGRTRYAVYMHAQRLGLRVGPGLTSEARAHGADAANAARRSKADRREAEVMALLDRGLPPSAIDVRLGLGPGTARKVISKRWRRDKKGEE